MSSSSERNTEIWSTRVQRELLALTEGSGGDVMAVLPPFITLQDKELDLAAGVCRVSFAIRIPGASSSISAKKEEETTVTTESATAATTTTTEGVETESQQEEGKTETATEAVAANDVDSAPANKVDEDEIVVTLDASLPRKPSDGSIDVSAGMYPFQQPRAILKSGAGRFPPGSTVQNGNMVDIDCDWTPSLHLSDAAVNVGLKIKESVLQQEPFHAAVEKLSRQQQQQREADPVEEMVQSARRFGSNLGRSIRSSLKMPAMPSIPSALTTVTPTTTTTSDEASSQQQLLTNPQQQLAPPPPAKPRSRRLGRKATHAKSLAASAKAKANPADIKIGDEINLLESPWVECRGVYSCKAIRRPEFVVDAMEHAASLTSGGGTGTALNNEVSNDPSRTTGDFADGGGDGEVPDHLGTYMRMQAGAIGQAANVGFAGAGAMFRSLTQTARSVLEESFLMITDTHVIELKSSKLNLSTGTITFCIAIDLLAKLKFRRQESISLFFKPAPDDPLIYMCPDSSDVVSQIQNVLKEHGVKGKHTNAAMNRLINEALQIVQHIQTKELALKHDPNVERVNEIMDLYRQAAERFEVAGDIRHEEVVTHMRRFLALPLTTSILDGSYKVEQKKTDGVPQGEVLERTSAHLDDDEELDDKESKEKEQQEDRVFEENMDNLMKEAKEDLAHLNIDDQGWNDDDDDLDAMLDSSGGSTGKTIEDLDAMLNAADKELADLMKS